MRREISVAPSNSVVLVMDRTTGVIPDSMSGGLVAATSSCVAIGTLSENDGETSICLSDEGRPSGLGDGPVFDGILMTPSRTLAVCSVLGEVLVEMQVRSDKTHVQMWANDTAEPDRIEVVVA